MIGFQEKVEFATDGIIWNTRRIRQLAKNILSGMIRLEKVLTTG